MTRAETVRYECPQCRRIYHLTFGGDALKCRNCGSILSPTDDDEKKPGIFVPSHDPN